MIAQHHQDTGNREDLDIYLNSGFSDLLNSLNSLNFSSIKEKLHSSTGTTTGNELGIFCG